VTSPFTHNRLVLSENAWLRKPSACRASRWSAPIIGTDECSAHSFQGFRSSNFNLSKVRKHFINPCCFGEDLAAWLVPKLAVRNIQTAKPYQEDWGWELPATCGNDAYYLCMSGNADNSGAPKDEGEWNIIVEKRRSFWQRLTGKGRIVTDDPLVRLIEEILIDEPTIRNLHRE